MSLSHDGAAVDDDEPKVEVAEVVAKEDRDVGDNSDDRVELGVVGVAIVGRAMAGMVAAGGRGETSVSFMVEGVLWRRGVKDDEDDELAAAGTSVHRCTKTDVKC